MVNSNSQEILSPLETICKVPKKKMKRVFNKKIKKHTKETLESVPSSSNLSGDIGVDEINLENNSTSKGS